jgi:hypothetical protein
MKTRSVRYVLAVSLMALPGLLSAQPTAHYVPGSEGIKGASLPPPGLYLRDYNLFYKADHLNDNRGHAFAPANFDGFIYANVPRVIYITDVKLLGGFVGVDALLPFIYQEVNAAGFNSSTFGIGDFFAEGTLSWHLKQFDISLASGVWMPSGDSAAPPTTRVGLGYWTFMQTAGATWYIDEQKTWAVSALNRYEFNTEQRDTHISPGQAYTMEWGVSKTVAKVWDFGAVGYYQQQVTTDGGNGAEGSRDRVAAVGPEVSIAFPQQMFFISFRYLYEFMAEGGDPFKGESLRGQGSTVTVTLTKRF